MPGTHAPVELTEVVFRHTDSAPFAIAELEDDGTIKFRNARFEALFGPGLRKDLVRREVDEEEVTAEIIKKTFATDSTVVQEDREQAGAIDSFYSWGGQTNDHPRFEILYALPKKAKFRSSQRYFQYWLRERVSPSEDQGQYTLFIEEITVSKRNTLEIQRTTEALSERLGELMVEGKAEADPAVGTPGLEYVISPVRGGVGGDFVFDWSVRKTAGVTKRALRISMVGDAEAPGSVGGLMAASVGSALKSVCLKPKDALGRCKPNSNLAMRVATHLNTEIIEHNATGSRGVDGVIMVTDTKEKKLHLAHGKFQALIFDVNATRRGEVTVFGKILRGGPKAFGEVEKPNFKTKKVSVTSTTIVVAISDGTLDVLYDKDYIGEDRDLRSLVIDKLKQQDVDAGSQDMRQVVRNLALDIQSCVEYEPPEEQERSSQGKMARDDTVVFVFSPLLRTWVDHG